MRFPHLTIYSDHLVKEGFAGKCYGFLIAIRPKYKNDVGLYEHEYVHVKQFYQSFFTMGIWYELLHDKRLQYEAEAYAEQVKYGASIERMAFFMTAKYDLDVTVEQAKKEIERYL